MIPVTILTPRLTLRPFRVEDGLRFAEVASENLNDPFAFYFKEQLEGENLKALIAAKVSSYRHGDELFFLVFLQSGPSRRNRPATFRS